MLNRIKKIFKSNKKISYSQKGEDLIINFIFKVLNIKKPTYLDIGANHPIKINNTYLFYKQGSRGVCVEPNPKLYKLIKNKRKKDIVLNIGIGREKKEFSDFYIMDANVLSTFSKKEADDIIKNTKHSLKEIIKIPLENINHIIENNFNNEAPNLISLDTEGYDLEILKSINLNKIRPEIFCIETLSYSEKNDEKKETEIIEFMENNDYYVHADTYINTIFIDKTKWLNR